MNAIITLKENNQTFTLTRTAAQHAAPGKGLVEFKKLSLSASTLRKDEVLTLKAEIEGEQIAHIYVEVYLKVDGQRIGPMIQEFVLSAENKEVGGVTYPVWGKKISISQNVPLGFPVLSHGGQSTLGAASPEKYTLVDSEKSYRMHGLLGLKNGSESYKARARFDANGKLISMTAVKEQHGKGFSREITLKPGDTFQPLLKIFPASELEDGLEFAADQVDADLSLMRSIQKPWAGDYEVGLRVQDVDGNSYYQVEALKVTGD
jgi:hypothetical protein